MVPPLGGSNCRRIGEGKEIARSILIKDEVIVEGTFLAHGLRAIISFLVISTLRARYSFGS